MSRLSIELTPEQHNAIKAMALLEGESIKNFVWKLVEPKLQEHRRKTKKQKGHGAGHKDCPLCRQFENARKGRYNAKTERVLRQPLTTKNSKHFNSFAELMADLKD